MRNNGIGYGQIASTLGISINSVKSYCQRNQLGGLRAADVSVTFDDKKCCRQCDQELQQVKGQKARKFCSDTCRMAWWHKHLNQLEQKAVYSFTCAGCGSAFSAYGNAKRKYCSHTCYISSRFSVADRLGELR